MAKKDNGKKKINYELTTQDIPRRSTIDIARDILRASKIAPLVDEVETRTLLREEKADAKALVDRNLGILNLSKDDYKYKRLMRDIDRARTLERLDDLTNDIKVEIELEEGLSTCLTMAQQIGFGEVFAGMHLTAKAAVARRALT